MPGIHPMPDMALRSLDATWCRERWEQLPEDGNRYEVIEGVLYMTTAPSSFHQWIVQQIFLMLHQQVNQQGIGVTFVAPIGLFMPECDPVQPDIVVVRTPDLNIIRERRIIGTPALIVEVLSPSNPNVDLHTKRRAYAKAGLPEYWIVRPASRDVLMCSQPDAALGDYVETHLVLPTGELVSPTLPIRTAIEVFFAGAPDTTW